MMKKQKKAKKTNIKTRSAIQDTRHINVQQYKRDRLSRLPDEVLLHILSMLPYKFALATVALSMRWIQLWNNNVVVKHGTCLEDIDCVVGSFLLEFEASNLLKCPQKLEVLLAESRALSATIGAHKLLLDFSSGEHLEFSSGFEWKMTLNTSIHFGHYSPACKFYVKTLNLAYVSNLTNDIISSLMSNFHCIKNLSIVKCQGLTNLHIDDIGAKLWKLTILDCPQLTCLTVEAYSLKSLRYRGLLCSFILRDRIKFEDAMFDFRGGKFNSQESYKCNQLLQAITNVKLLTLPGWMFKEYVSPWSVSSGTETRFNELTDLWWIDNSVEEHKIQALFSFMKLCPALERLFITIDPASYYNTSSTTANCLDQVSDPANLKELKVVRLEGFNDDEDIILLKDRLQQVFNREPRFIAVTHGSPSRCLIRIPKYLRKTDWSMFETKKSKKPKKSPYKFVEETDEEKHRHMLLYKPQVFHS